MDTVSPQTSSEISEWVSRAALRLEDKVIAWRRDIHQNPELSGQENKTATKLADRLRRLGYEVTTGVGGHGIVALLRNGNGPTLMLRTDMDALPIEEKTGLPYASKVTAPGPSGTMVPVMHACGHDVHMAALTALTRAAHELGDALCRLVQGRLPEGVRVVILRPSLHS